MASRLHGKPKGVQGKGKGVKKSGAGVKAGAGLMDLHTRVRDELNLPLNFDTPCGKRVAVKGSGQRGRYIVTLTCPPLNVPPRDNARSGHALGLIEDRQKQHSRMSLS